MTKRRSKPSEQKSINTPQPIIAHDVEDEEGRPVRLLTPEGQPPEGGIPTHLNLTEIYGHLPVEFQRAIIRACWERGLIEPQDFLQADSAGKFRQALHSVIRNEWLKVLHLAQENTK